MSNSTRALLLRMAPSIYGPTILFTLGQSAVMPLIPVIAVGMGAGIGLSGFIASALVVGQLAGNLPAGWIVARAGERIAMLIATGVAFFGAIGIVLAPNPGTLGVAVFVIGFAAATFGLARHSFMTTRVPVAFRARALSLIGGSHRLGRLEDRSAAGILALTASPVAPVRAFVVCLALTALLVTCAPDPEQALPVQRPVEERSRALRESGPLCATTAPRSRASVVLRRYSRVCAPPKMCCCRSGRSQSAWTPPGWRSWSESLARSISRCSTRVGR
ncbi:MFS transporter [Leucobacter luti]|uniref:MFS transporter n=1 Tax=Leucobacter luti TaxID=340320 RepID=UPI0037C053B8